MDFDGLYRFRRSSLAKMLKLDWFYDLHTSTIRHISSKMWVPICRFLYCHTLSTPLGNRVPIRNANVRRQSFKSLYKMQISRFDSKQLQLSLILMALVSTNFTHIWMVIQTFHGNIWVSYGILHSLEKFWLI